MEISVIDLRLSLSGTIYHIKAHLSVYSLTQLGEQSSRRNPQLPERQVITKHKASSQQLPSKYSFQNVAAKRQCKGRIFREPPMMLIMLSLKWGLKFTIL